MPSIEHNDPLNARILAVSEDKIQGFVREPFAEIAERSGVPLETVIERIRVMLAAGTIRRGRSGTPPHPDALLLARGGAGISQREHHGRGPRDRQGTAPRSQAGHRPAPGGLWNPGELHQCLLGGPKRDQAVGDFARCVPGMAGAVYLSISR